MFCPDPKKMDKIKDAIAQPKSIGKANANNAQNDTISETQVSLPPPVFQLKKKPSHPETEEKEESTAKEGPYQMAAAGGEPPADPSPSDSDESPSPPFQAKPNKTGLPDQLKSGVENLSGFSLDDVKVHRNSDKPAQLQAHAYAQGTDIHLGPGQEKHLPHEAWHVVQQKQGRVQPTTQLKAFNINDDAGLEKEADMMGQKALKNSASPEKNLKSSKLSSVSSPIQGKFGFELELTIAVEAEMPDGSFQDPKNAVGIHLAKGNQLELHVDHQETKAIMGAGVVDDSMYNNNGAPIIEIVTDALDEFDPNIDQDVTNLIAELDAIQTALLAARGNRTKLNTIIAGAHPSLVVGGLKVGRQNTKSYTHATYGVKLDQVSKVFSDHADEIRDKKGEGSVRATNLDKAVTAGEEVSDWIFNKYKDRSSGILKWKDLNKYDIHDESDMEKIKGLLILLANYMITLNLSPGKLLKNQVGVFFYKSKLNELVAHLSDKQKSLLDNRSNKIADQLITKCIEQREDNLQTNMSWKDWIREVLKGNDDRILTGAKNPYSPKLGPDQLGPAGNQDVGVVMENRYIVELLQNVGKKIDPADWPNMIRAVKNILTDVNDQ